MSTIFKLVNDERESIITICGERMDNSEEGVASVRYSNDCRRYYKLWAKGYDAVMEHETRKDRFEDESV